MRYPAMAKIYANLVRQQLRAVTEEDAVAWGVPMVPAFIRDDVIALLEGDAT